MHEILFIMETLQGASHHQDLFESNTRRDDPDKIVPQDDTEFEEEEKLLAETYGAIDPKDDPLQLEHMIGYSGDFRQSHTFVPGNGNKYYRGYDGIST